MKSIALLSLAAAAWCAPTAEPEPIKLGLPRRRSLTSSTGHVDARQYLGQLQYTLQKYGKQVELVKGLKDVIKRSGAESLKDQGDDELYYGNVQVGSQTFTIDFDTGSSDLFVPGPKCGKSQGCSGTTKYNQGGTDEKNTTQVTYGSGSVSGENYYDSVTVAGLTATHQNVVSLTTATGFSGSDAEGLMGMAFESIANSKQPPYFTTLVNEKKVAKPEFSFYLGREKDGTGKNSELTLGGTDSSKYTGSFTTVPLNAETYWQVPVKTVQVNGKSATPVDLTAGSAAIDTGTTIIIAPYQSALDIYTLIPGAIPIPVDGGTPVIFGYPCKENPKVAFEFVNKPFVINEEDFNLGSLTSELGSLLGNSTLASLLDGAVDYCLGAIAGEDISTTENLYVVGDTFLKNWYASFSYTSANGKPGVSFAKSI